MKWEKDQNSNAQVLDGMTDYRWLDGRQGSSTDHKDDLNRIGYLATNSDVQRQSTSCFGLIWPLIDLYPTGLAWGSASRFSLTHSFEGNHNA